MGRVLLSLLSLPPAMPLPVDAWEREGRPPPPPLPVLLVLLRGVPDPICLEACDC